MSAALDKLEAEVDAACAVYRAALRTMKRSRSEKNRIALVVAGNTHNTAVAAYVAAREREDRAATVAARLAATASHRAQRAAQVQLFT